MLTFYSFRETGVWQQFGSKYDETAFGSKRGTFTMIEERPFLNNLCSRFILFKDLKKQNNFLKLKVELLLDMLAQKSAEADILQKDIDQIRKCLLPQ